MPDVTRGQRAGDRLREALVSKKLLTREELDKALELQKRKGGSLSRIVVEQGWVDSESLVAALSQSLHIPSIRLSRMEVDPELAKLIPGRQAFYHRVVPVSQMGDQLTVAMADPMNVLALDQFNQATGLKITVFLTTEEDIQQALFRLYGGSIKESLEALAEGGQNLGGIELLSGSQRRLDETAEELFRKTQQSPVVRVTQAILTEGVSQRASDILIEPFEKNLRIRCRVDGVFQEVAAPPPAMYSGIVSRIKVMANLNIAEHRLPQDGRIKLMIGKQGVDFRVSVIPSYYGEKVCLRILDKSQVNLDIRKLGFGDEPMKALREAAQKPNGMILITGPTGSGKTTTLYALLKLLDSPGRNMVTIEDPVEYDLQGINQVSIRPDVGLTFAAGLRSILRQDPDVILVGEIRDQETADIAVKAALTGHLVLSTLHANDALGTVARLSNMGIEPHLIGASVALFGAQRLLRKVCTGCAGPFHPTKELAAQLKLPEGNYRKGKGCSKCGGTGLAGRIGVLETVPATSELRQMLTDRASAGELRETVRAQGHRFLWDYALAQAAGGVIPLEEVVRATVEQNS